MPRRSKILTLAKAIDGARFEALEPRLAAIDVLASKEQALAVAVLLATAYPALAHAIEAAPEVVRSLVEEGWASPRDRASLLARLRARVAAAPPGEEHVRRELRRAAQAEKMRVALRELLPGSLGGADVDVTSAELAALGEATIEVALDEALAVVTARHGPPRTERGAPGRFVVLGMGKLGGRELNAGSDVDLVYFYDTDEGEASQPGSPPISLHDFWTRVARRLTSTLEEVTADGFVWRVDLRLRPEGRTGPLVNSLAAAERYYESFGRLWERAAVLRARPVAGDLRFGEELLAAVAPFVWRKQVDPTIAVEMVHLAKRARTELSDDPASDLKLGPGGIRDAELFVQTLQLIWGGREPRLRAKGTLEALARLRAHGFVTDREAREIEAAYLALRRAEHAVQTATGRQTHALPGGAEDLARLARALGFEGAAALRADLERHQKRVARRLVSLLPEGAEVRAPWDEAVAAIERGDRHGLAEVLARAAAERSLGSPAGSDETGSKPASAEGIEMWIDVAGHLFELARRPDAPLGEKAREAHPAVADAILDEVVDAADPEQAARYLRMLFARLRHPGLYVRMLAGDPFAVRRLVSAVGASAFIGDAVASNPELGDLVMFTREAPTPVLARAEVTSALAEGASAEHAEDEEDDAVVGALRRAKARVTLEVGLAELSGEIGTREAVHVLTALADASLEAATRRAFGARAAEIARGGPDAYVRGLVVLGMGKLGGREIGYGSDLDVVFLYDPAAAPAGVDPDAYFARGARRTIRLVSVSHAAGRGYELDTRLRPSGSQGLLVTSIHAFARYHGKTPSAPSLSTEGQPPPDAPRAMRHVRAAAWERLALLRARPVAGDPELGVRALRIAHAAAYEAEDDPRRVAVEVHRLRTRMEQELSLERRGRHDLKLGRGGLVDVEFCVQLLQMRHGPDPRVRTTETPEAIEALASAGYLAPAHAATLRDGYAFLRRLEQRIRIVHADAAHLLEENAPGLAPLARRMGIVDRPRAAAAAELLARYRDVTERVRETYEAIVVLG